MDIPRTYPVGEPVATWETAPFETLQGDFVINRGAVPENWVALPAFARDADHGDECISNSLYPGHKMHPQTVQFIGYMLPLESKVLGYLLHEGEIEIQYELYGIKHGAQIYHGSVSGILAVAPHAQVRPSSLRAFLLYGAGMLIALFSAGAAAYQLFRHIF